MSKFRALIKTYEDFELAFLKKYRYQSLLSFTREILDQELAERNLREHKLNQFISELEFSKTPNPDEDSFCLRCTSKKHHIQQVEQYNDNTLGRFSYLDNDSYRTDAKKIDVKICSVCGYTPESTEVREYTIWDIFKRMFRGLIRV